MDFARRMSRSRGSRHRLSPQPSPSTGSIPTLGLSNNNNNNGGGGSKTRIAKLTRSRRRARSAVTKDVVVPPGFPEIWSLLREQQQLCDGIIRTSDGQKIPIHRGVLAGSSPFCHQEFIKNDTKELKVAFDGPTIDSFINFAYRGSLNPSMDNVQALLELAARFQVPSITRICWKFLNSELAVENCLQILGISKKYFCKALQNTVKTFILVNFDKLVMTQGFLTMDAGDLAEFFREDNVNLSEMKIFEALQKWFAFAPDARIGAISIIFKTLRFGLMDYRYFASKVTNWHVLSMDPDLRLALGEAEEFMAKMESLNGNEIDLYDPMARPRIPNEILFAVGGWSAGSPTAFMETYDFRADRWFLSAFSDTTPRAYHGLIALDGLIYMVGGFDGNDHFSSMKCFDPVTKAWTEKACMYNPRCYVSCCTLDGKIYALGGYNGRTRMNTAEVYDPMSNQWTMIAAMNRQRSDASACSLKGKIYIAGGFNGQEVLSSVEVLDPAEGQWSFILPMLNARSGVSMVAHNDCLWAIGGFNGFNRLASAEKYDPGDPTREWELVADMNSPRSNFAVAVLYDTIFVIGGFNGSTTIPFVEYFDEEGRVWKDASHMNLNRSALSACVLKGFPNTKDYCYLARLQEILGIGSTDDEMLP